jgi:CRISPR/Cas system CSM-associated protein Csm2 small subunit
MAKYIGFLLAKIHPSEWDNFAYKIAEDANVKNSPPLSQTELRSIFDSITSIERRNNADRWYKKEEQKEVSSMWKETENKIMLMKDIAGMQEFQE